MHEPADAPARDVSGETSMARASSGKADLGRLMAGYPDQFNVGFGEIFHRQVLADA